jgi:hypothetical protein
MADAQALAVAALANAAQALGIPLPPPPPPPGPGGILPGGVPPQVGILSEVQAGGGAGLVLPGPPLQPLQPLQHPQPLHGGQQGVGQGAGSLFLLAAQQGFGAVGQVAFPPMGAGAQQHGYGGQVVFYPPYGYGQYASGGYGFPGQQWPGFYPPFPAQVQTAPAAASAADVNLDMIVQLLKTAPPRVPADAAGGRFAVDIDGNILVVARAQATEEYLSATSKDEDKRWLGITGMAATMGNSDASRKLRPMFEALSLAVCGLKDLWRRMPCSQK